MGMMYYNKGQLIGNVVKKPELYAMDNAKKTEFCYVTLAVNRKMYGKDKEPVTDFIDVMAYSWNARNIVDKASKGVRLFVDYHIQTYSKKTNDGKYNKTVQIIMDDFSFLGRTSDALPDTNNGKSDSVDEAFADDDTEMPFDI